MSTSAPLFTTVGIVGTGAMGRGIAQIAAQAGAVVRLFDTQPDAVAKAQAALGPRFDPRDFHAQVLKDGSVPLDVLEAKIDAWIATRQAPPG